VRQSEVSLSCIQSKVRQAISHSSMLSVSHPPSQLVSDLVTTVICQNRNDADYISEVVGTDFDGKVFPIRDMKTLDGGDCPASVHGRLTPRGYQSRYPLNSSLVGPQSQSRFFRGK
jgi:hypothetical protein